MAARKIDSYDVSPKMREVIEWKYNRRKELRHQYLKEVLNPTKHLLPVDSGIQRVSLLRTQHQHIREITFKYHAVTALLWVGSIYTLGRIFKYLTRRRDGRYRSGLVSYADREPKCA